MSIISKIRAQIQSMVIYTLPVRIALILLFLPSLVSAQTSSKNQFALSGTGAYYFNKVGLKQADNPDNPISIQNSGGYSFGLSYCRVIKNKFLIGISYEFGGETLRGNVRRDLTNFDSENAPERLKGFTFNYNIDVNTHFFYPRLLFGFQQPVSKTSSFQVLAGFGEKFTKRKNPSTNQFVIEYANDIGSELYTKEFGYITTNITGDKLNVNPFNYKEPLLSASLEVRLVHVLKVYRNIGFLAGIVIEHGVNMEQHRQDSRFIIVNSRKNVDDKPGYYNNYGGRNFSIGIKLGIGVF